MPRLIKEYYYSFYELNEATPYVKLNLKNFLLWLFGEDLEEGSLDNYQVPSDLTTNAAIYNELFSLIYGRYNKEYVIKLVKGYNESSPTSEEIENALYEWGYIFLTKLNLTYEYYMPLLTFYRANKSNLMNDITATSRNKVKFNDTPQNPNASAVYEGDDYITNFTSTENVSSSELNSKIMRLKEIQDNYMNVLYEWVNQFEKIFIERNDV